MNQTRVIGKARSFSLFNSKSRPKKNQLLRTWLAISFALLMLIFMTMAVSTLEAGILSDVPTLEQGVYYAVLGMLMLGGGLLTYQGKIVQFTYSKTKSLVGEVNWVLGFLGLFCIVALIETSIHKIGIHELQNASSDVQFLLLVSGCALLIWGFGGLGWPWRWIKALQKLSKIERYETAFVLFITALGLGIRFWKLETSVLQFIDELNFATVSTYFRGSNSINILDPIVRGFPAIYPYLQNEMANIFGHNLFALRSISVLLGTLGIPATYLLARTLFDRPTAILAGLLMVSFPPHIHFSRLGLNNIADATFGVLALAFLARGLRYNRRLDFVIGGVALGLTQYFYEGGRLLFPPLVALWCTYGLITGYSRQRLTGLLWAALMAVVVAAPIYLTLDALDAPLTPRVNTVGSEDGLLGLRENIEDRATYLPKLRLSFLVYFSQEEFSIIWYGGDTALIFIFLAPMFLIGIAYVLCTGWRPHMLLLPWLVFTSVGVSLIHDSGGYIRYTATLPALVILIAVGIQVLLTLLIPRTMDTERRALIRVLSVLGVILCLFQAIYYFGPHLTHFNQQIRAKNAYDAQDVVFRMAHYPVGSKAYVFAGDIEDEKYLNGALGYLIDNSSYAIRLYAPEDINRDFLNTIVLQERIFIFLPPDIDKKSLFVLHRFFFLDGPTFSPYDSVPKDKQLMMYEIIDYRR